MGLAVEAALVGRCGPPAAPFFGDAMAHEQGLEKAELLSTGAARRTGAAYQRDSVEGSNHELATRKSSGGIGA